MLLAGLDNRTCAVTLMCVFPCVFSFGFHNVRGLSWHFQIIQLIGAGTNYFGFENMIEWIAYVASILLVIDVNQCQMDNSGVREVVNACHFI